MTLSFSSNKKTKKWDQRFSKLEAANIFKIENPPYYHYDKTPDYDWDEYNQKEVQFPKLQMLLIFTLPIIVETYYGEENISLEYLLEMDPKHKDTLKCSFTISHQYVEAVREGNQVFIMELERKVKKAKEALRERNSYLPPILKSLKNYEEEEKYVLRFSLMLKVFKQNNHNFLKQKKQYLFYKEDIIYVDNNEKSW